MSKSPTKNEAIFTSGGPVTSNNFFLRSFNKIHTRREILQLLFAGQFFAPI